MAALRDDDYRMLLLTLGAEGVEASAKTVLRLWRNTSREGRMLRALARLEKREWIAPSGDETADARILRLTEAGRAAVRGPVDPEARWKRPWDGKWRLVAFDVPQARNRLRVRLRRRLRELGFGWLQNSVWISPDPVDALTSMLEAERVATESLVLMEARPVGGESDPDLVAGAWDFGLVAKRHAAYLEVTRRRPGRRERGDLAAWRKWLQVERRAWRQVLAVDPLLPEPLLPAGYAGRIAWQARLEALAACGAAGASVASAD